MEERDASRAFIDWTVPACELDFEAAMVERFSTCGYACMYDATDAFGQNASLRECDAE
jgi:hypothetical protein